MYFYHVAIHPSLTSGEQFDAHEFLIMLLNHLIKKMPLSIIVFVLLKSELLFNTYV